MLVEAWRTGKPVPWWWGCEPAQPPGKTVCRFSSKRKSYHIQRCCSSPWGIQPKESNPLKEIPALPCSPPRSSRALRTTPVALGRYVDEEDAMGQSSAMTKEILPFVAPRTDRALRRVGQIRPRKTTAVWCHLYMGSQSTEYVEDSNADRQRLRAGPKGRCWSKRMNFHLR